MYLTTVSVFDCGSKKLNIVIHLCFYVCMHSILAVNSQQLMCMKLIVCGINYLNGGQCTIAFMPCPLDVFI